MSSHLRDIPEAVRIAAITTAVDLNLKEQALEYLNKVKTLCDETWEVSYLFTWLMSGLPLVVSPRSWCRDRSDRQGWQGEAGH